MNRREHVLLRPQPISGRPPKNRGPRIAANARSEPEATADTCPFRGLSQQARAAGDELTSGFLRHRRTKRMTATKKEGPVSTSQTGPGGHSSRPRLAIPCWVAPLQSPTPFRQAPIIILQAPGVRSTAINGKPSCAKLDRQKPAHEAKIDRTRSPAPATARRHWAHDNAGNDGHSFDPINSIAILTTEGRPHPFTCRY